MRGLSSEIQSGRSNKSNGQRPKSELRQYQHVVVVVVVVVIFHRERKTKIRPSFVRFVI